MAQYKNGYKRSNDRFLTYLLVGFAGVIVTLVLGLIIYNVVNPSLDYDSFDHLTSFQTVTTQSEDEYIVYYYSENCGYCQQIKDRVLNFAEDNPAGIKVYLLDALETTGVNNISDPTSGQTMSGTPSFITVVNGTIVHMAPGYENVLDVITSVNDGTYAYID